MNIVSRRACKWVTKRSDACSHACFQEDYDVVEIVRSLIQNPLCWFQKASTNYSISVAHCKFRAGNNHWSTENRSGYQDSGLQPNIWPDVCSRGTKMLITPGILTVMEWSLQLKFTLCCVCVCVGGVCRWGPPTHSRRSSRKRKRTCSPDSWNPLTSTTSSLRTNGVPSILTVWTIMFGTCDGHVTCSALLTP